MSLLLNSWSSFRCCLVSLGGASATCDQASEYRPVASATAYLSTAR
ncbi:hypothetical protein [Streptomyces griseoaurantiacus]|nr:MULTISPECIES: hypothetical protein [Streptomyces]